MSPTVVMLLKHLMDPRVSQCSPGHSEASEWHCHCPQQDKRHLCLPESPAESPRARGVPGGDPRWALLFLLLFQQSWWAQLGLPCPTMKDSAALHAQKLFLIFSPQIQKHFRDFQVQITIILRSVFQQHLHRLVWSLAVLAPTGCLGEPTLQFWHLACRSTVNI